MLRSSLIFLCPLLFLTACTSVETQEEIDPDLGYITTYTVDAKTGERTGPYTVTDSTGVLMEKGLLQQGIPHGVRELYYPEGNVKVRERYVEGRLDDLYEYYFPNGKIELKGYYVDGAMYGMWRKYRHDGSLFDEVMMIKNEEMGPFKEYHPNGQIQAEGTYLNGPFEEGTLKLYNESGQLQKEMFCVAGRCRTVWAEE